MDMAEIRTPIHLKSSVVSWISFITTPGIKLNIQNTVSLKGMLCKGWVRTPAQKHILVGQSLIATFKTAEKILRVVELAYKPRRLALIIKFNVSTSRTIRYAANDACDVMIVKHCELCLGNISESRMMLPGKICCTPA